MTRARLILTFVVGLGCWARPAAVNAQSPDSLLGFNALDSLLNTPISSAAKYRQTARDAAASVTIITAEDIRRYGYRSLVEVLASVRGFYTTNDRTSVSVGVRGFSRPDANNSRILLLIDGHSLNENLYNGAPFTAEPTLDIGIVERLEIVRGPASALYGSGAMLAVVNVVTKSGAAVDGLRISGEVGSLGARSTNATFGREFSWGGDVLVTGSWTDVSGTDLYFPEYDSPLTNSGVAEDLNWTKSYGVFGRARFRDLRFAAGATSLKKGIPTGAFGGTFNDPAAQVQTRRLSGEVVFDHDVGAGQNLLLRGYYDYSQLHQTIPLVTRGRVEGINEGQWVGAEAQFRWDVTPWNRVKVGAEYRNHFQAEYFASDSLAVHVDGDYPSSLVSVYATDELQIRPNLALTVGFRLDDYSTVGSSLTPRGAVVYHPGKSTTLKVLYGQAFRAPNPFEFDLEPDSFITRNTALRPERIRTAELIWEQRLTRGFFGTVAVYEYHMEDLIERTVDPTTGLQRFETVQHVDARGFELGINARSVNGLSGYASYVYQVARDVATETLTNSPRHQFRAGASAQLSHGVGAAVSLAYDHDRGTVQGGTTESYFLGNVTLSKTAWRDRLRLSVQVRNVLDTEYQTPAGFTHRQQGITQDGRTVRVRADIKY